MTSPFGGHHFTIHRDPAIDERIARDVVWLRARILREYPQTKALFLVGGFGRGEGGVVRRGDQWRPVNDYDLELIADRTIDPVRLQALGRECARELGLPFVHIESYPAWRLRWRPLTIYSCDLKHASLTLYDPQRLLASLPNYDPSRMPLSEGRALLFTRLNALLLVFDPDKEWHNATLDEKFDLATQLSKALLAVQDARLILHHAYHPSYVERRKRIARLCAGESELLELTSWAAAFKLDPETPPPSDLKVHWYRVKDIYLRELRHFLESMYERELPDWASYERVHFGHWRTWARRFYMTLRGRRRWFYDYLLLTMGHIYLLEAAGDETRINQPALAQARRLYKKISLVTSALPNDWNVLRQRALTFFDALW